MILHRPHSGLQADVLASSHSQHIGRCRPLWTMYNYCGWFTLLVVFGIGARFLPFFIKIIPSQFLWMEMERNKHDAIFVFFVGCDEVIVLFSFRVKSRFWIKSIFFVDFWCRETPPPSQLAFHSILKMGRHKGTSPVFSLTQIWCRQRAGEFFEKAKVEHTGLKLPFSSATETSSAKATTRG